MSDAPQTNSRHRIGIVAGIFFLALIPILWIAIPKYLKARDQAYQTEIRGNITEIVAYARQLMMQTGRKEIPSIDELLKDDPTWQIPTPINGEDYNDLFPIPWDRDVHRLTTASSLEVWSTGGGGRKRPWYFF